MAYTSKWYDFSNKTVKDIVVADENAVPGAYAYSLNAISNGIISNCTCSTGGQMRVYTAGGNSLIKDSIIDANKNEALIIRHAGNSGSNLTFKTGSSYIQSKAVLSGATVSGGELWVQAGATAHDVAVSGGALILTAANGDTLVKRVTQTGGRVYVSEGILSGGTVNGGEMDAY